MLSQVSTIPVQSFIFELYEPSFSYVTTSTHSFNPAYLEIVAVMCIACTWSNDSPENEAQLTSPYAALENYLEFVCFDPET